MPQQAEMDIRGWIKYKPTSALNFLLKHNFTKLKNSHFPT